MLDALDAAPAVLVGRSYGGGIALDLAARYPDKVHALVLLEPAVDSLAPETENLAENFLAETFGAGHVDPRMVGETFIRALAGDDAWEAFPDGLKEVIIGNGPAILAELRGTLVRFTPETLAEITQSALIVAGADSPPEYHLPLRVLGNSLPNARSVAVPGGHLADPASPKVLEFIEGFAS